MMLFIKRYSINKSILHNLLILRLKIAKRTTFHKLVNHKLVKFKNYNIIHLIFLGFARRALWF